MYKIVYDFEIKTDHLILARKPDSRISNRKNNLLSSGVLHPSESLSEKERKRKD